jgi:hypothetical protein
MFGHSADSSLKINYRNNTLCPQKRIECIFITEKNLYIGQGDLVIGLEQYIAISIKSIFSQADTRIDTFSKISTRKKNPANFILNITSQMNLIYNQSEHSVFCKLRPRL